MGTGSIFIVLAFNVLPIDVIESNFYEVNEGIVASYKVFREDSFESIPFDNYIELPIHSLN